MPLSFSVSTTHRTNTFEQLSMIIFFFFFFSFQIDPLRHIKGSKYKQYSHESLKEAYKAVKEENICVLKASRLYGVPDQTLRDRISGRISIDTLKSGR